MNNESRCEIENQFIQYGWKSKLRNQMSVRERQYYDLEMEKWAQEHEEKTKEGSTPEGLLTEEGKKYLKSRKGFKADFVDRLPEFGFSSIANIIASIKLAKKMKLTKNDAIITVATDGADLYETELAKTKKQFSKIYDQVTCAEIFAKNFEAITVDHTLELSQIDKERIFNLGYYTWVEQQGTSLEEFEDRRNQSFWDKHYKDMISLDPKIKEFNSL